MLISTIFNICPLHLDGWEAPLQTAFKVQPAIVSTVSETAPETAETGETGETGPETLDAGEDLGVGK